MNRIQRELRRALRETERATGNTVFTWSGNDYLCTQGGSSQSLVLGNGGFAPDDNLTLYVRSDLLPDPGPESKQELVFGDKAFRIEDVSSSPGDAFVKIVCKDPNRGA